MRDMRNAHDWRKQAEMDLVLLKTLIKVASVGSISKAAAVLCVTQSAVSRRIKQLEEHYGTELIDRSGPVVRPTEAGGLLLESARKILDIEEEVRQSLDHRSARGKLSFCCTPSFGVTYLPPVVNAYVENHQDPADLQFVFDMPEVALSGVQDGRFHAALIEHCSQLDLEGYETYPIPDDEIVFVSAPSLGISERMPSIDRLMGERLFLKSERGCAKRFLEQNMKGIGRDWAEFGNVVYIDDIPCIISEVVAGHGIGFISAGAVSAHVAGGLLLEHRVCGFDHWRKRTLVLARDQDASPTLDAFVSALLRAFISSAPKKLQAV